MSNRVKPLDTPVTFREAIEKSGKARTTLYYYIMRGELNPFDYYAVGNARKQRVFDRAEFMAWLAEQEDKNNNG